MATADQIERIILELEEQGAAGAYVAVKRVNSAFDELEKKQGPAGVLEGFNALQDSLARSLVDLPNMAALTDQATAAWTRLVAQVRRYEESQGRKRDRNQAILAAKQEAETNEAAYRAALVRQDEHSQSMRRRDRNAQILEGKAQEDAYQAALRRQDKFAAKMRSGESPFGGDAKAAPKLSAQAKFGQMLFKSFGPKTAQTVGNVADMLQKVGPIAAKVGPPVANAALAIGALSVAAAGAGVYAAKEFGGAVIQAQAFREDMSFALEAITGSKAESDRIIDRAAKTADFIGQERAATVGQFTTLVGKKLDVGMVDNIVRAMADLKTKAPTANIDAMVTAIGQIRTKGKLSGEELMQLSEAGLNTSGVFEALSKKTGKSVEEMQKQVSAGKIDWKEGIDAILASSNQGSGALGSLANKKSRSGLTDLMRMVGDIPQNILFDVKVGSGVDGVKDTLRTILDFFDEEKGQGKEVRKVTGDLFNALIEGLTGDKVDTKKGITGTLDTMVGAAKSAVPLVRDLASSMRAFAGVAASVGGAMAWVSEATAPLGGLVKIAKTVSLPFRVLLATMIGPFTVLPELYSAGKNLKDLFSAGDWGKGLDKLTKALPGMGLLTDIGGAITSGLSSAWDGLKQAASDAFNSAITIGANIPRGIISGIMGGLGSVVSAGISVAQAALGGTSGELQVRSPSRAYAYLGEMSNQGLEKQLYAGVPAIYQAGAAIGSASLDGTAGAMGPANTNGTPRLLAAPSSSATGAAAPVMITLAPTIQVVGAKNEVQAQAFGAAAARGAQPEFEAMMGTAYRRLALGG